MSGAGLGLRRRRVGEATSQVEVRGKELASAGAELSSTSSSSGRAAWRKSGVLRWSAM